MSKLSDAIAKLKSYPCTSCGTCCTRIDIAVRNFSKFSLRYNIPIEELDFPYEYDVTGRCENLSEDGRCKVYTNRPNVCNVEWWAKRVNEHRGEFFLEQINACNDMMEKDGIDKSYRIVI